MHTKTGNPEYCTKSETNEKSKNYELFTGDYLDDERGAGNGVTLMSIRKRNLEKYLTHKHEKM